MGTHINVNERKGLPKYQKNFTGSSRKVLEIVCGVNAFSAAGGVAMLFCPGAARVVNEPAFTDSGTWCLSAVHFACATVWFKEGKGVVKLNCTF